MIRYFPAIIEGGDAAGYCVFFPDLPGCTSAGETIDEAARNAEDALSGHLALMAEAGESVPDQRPLDQITTEPDVLEVARILVRAQLPGRMLRFDLSLDEDLIDQIDRTAAARGMTRSRFLAEAARQAIIK